MQNVHVLIIDPQRDFMDDPDSALAVPGANEDMRRLAALVDRIGAKVDDIHVTLDSHRVIDVGHPGMWQDANGEMPQPFTVITAAEIESDIWQPRNAHVKPARLEGRTLGQYMLEYARQLEAQGNYPLMVWPEHCIIGSSGYSIQEDLMAALQRWERRQFANVDFVAKGTNTFTEHYGALQAEVPMVSDPSTGLNTKLLDILTEADIVVVAGEALSHCVKSTVDQIAENLGDEQVKKFYILTDCSSPVPQTPGGPDFPAIAQQWLSDMERRGMNLVESDSFLA